MSDPIISSQCWREPDNTACLFMKQRRLGLFLQHKDKLYPISRKPKKEGSYLDGPSDYIYTVEIFRVTTEECFRTPVLLAHELKGTWVDPIVAAKKCVVETEWGEHLLSDPPTASITWFPVESEERYTRTSAVVRHVFSDITENAILEEEIRKAIEEQKSFEDSSS